MKILMIGPLPPPYTGASVSFQKLLDSMSEITDLSVDHINISTDYKKHVVGNVSLIRSLETIQILLRVSSTLLSNSYENIYITKGSTKLGLLRDISILILKKLFACKSKLIVHLKGGNYDDLYFSCGAFLKFLIRYFLLNVDRIIVLGPSLVNMYRFLPSLQGKIVIIENALAFEPDNLETRSFVDGKLTSPSEISLEQNSKFEKDIVNILFLSNLIYTKGYGHLLDACEILLRRGI